VTDREGPDVAELWVLQTRERRLWFGLRVTAARPTRRVELPGALRPAVAAAMLLLVERSGPIIDPCCGTGTIVLASESSGRIAVAGDLAEPAVAAARANGIRNVARVDARQSPFASSGAAAVVTNLPFGRQHLVQGAPVAWYRRVLTEALRVAPQAVVLAAPTTPFRQALGRLDVDLRGRHDITLLGNRTVIWDLHRR
jgi:tRNA G10  N-methylase Trm11